MRWLCYVPCIRTHNPCSTSPHIKPLHIGTSKSLIKWQEIFHFYQLGKTLHKIFLSFRKMTRNVKFRIEGSLQRHSGGGYGCCNRGRNSNYSRLFLVVPGSLLVVQHIDLHLICEMQGVASLKTSSPQLNHLSLIFY